MRMRRSESAFLNPTLIGAVTVLIAIVAVFLAYNANSGLPFVPTYNVHMVVPDAAELIPGNEVQIAGSHVGIVRDIAPTVRNGIASAMVTLQLNKNLQELPADTSAEIRLRSNLGLKYVALFPGHAKQGIPDGGSINPSLVAPVVNLDDLFDTFNQPTRHALQTVVTNLGDGFAGRGSDFNDTLGALPTLTSRLVTVGQNLASPRSDLAGFIGGLNSAATRVDPVAAQLADLFDKGATTFGAITPSDLANTMTQAASTEQAALPSLRPTTALLKAGLGVPDRVPAWAEAAPERSADADAHARHRGPAAAAGGDAGQRRHERGGRARTRREAARHDRRARAPDPVIADPDPDAPVRRPDADDLQLPRPVDAEHRFDDQPGRHARHLVPLLAARESARGPALSFAVEHAPRRASARHRPERVVHRG